MLSKTIQIRWLSTLVCLAVLAIHLGLNEFASVQFLAFIILFVISLRFAALRLNEVAIVFFALILSIIVSALIANHDPMTVLKGVRSAIVLCLLYIWTWTTNAISKQNKISIFNGIKLAIQISLIVSCLQLADSLTINTGSFDIPESWFSLEYGTLAYDRRDHLASIGVFIRPTSFFSEPSALAALSLLGLAIANEWNDKRLRIASAALLVISMSLAGLLLGVLFLLFSGSRIGQHRQRLFSVIFGTILISAIGIFVFQERIANISVGGDLSATIRIFEPLKVLYTSLNSGNFFGATPEFLLSLADSEVYTIFDNWALNQLLLYGVMGIVWLVFPAILLRGWPLALFLAYSVTNGDALYYDRFLFLSLLILCRNKHQTNQL